MKSLYTVLFQTVLARSKLCSKNGRKCNNVQKVETLNGKEVRTKST